jgi:hypothetical protein
LAPGTYTVEAIKSERHATSAPFEIAARKTTEIELVLP